MLWEELLKEVILHITPLCSLLPTLLKTSARVCRMCENCKSLVLQDKCNIEIFLSPDCKSLGPEFYLGLSNCAWFASMMLYQELYLFAKTLSTEIMSEVKNFVS